MSDNYFDHISGRGIPDTRTKEDRKGHTIYKACWRGPHMKISKPIRFDDTRDAKVIRDWIISWLRMSDFQEEILITVYGFHDNGFRDQYEFFLKKDGVIHRCLYNALRRKAVAGNVSAILICKFIDTYYSKETNVTD